MSEATANSLVGLICDAAVSAPGWGTFLDELMVALDVPRATMFFHSDARQRGQVVVARAFEDREVVSYEKY